MIEFFQCFLVICVTAMFSLCVFAISATRNKLKNDVALEQAFLELDTIFSKFNLWWKQGKFSAIFKGTFAMFYAYGKLKRKNQIGTADLVLVLALLSLLGAYATPGIIDLLMEMLKFNNLR